MPNNNGLDTLVTDPDFANLAPMDQRRALASVSGDSSFSQLNDAQTGQYISAHQAMIGKGPSVSRGNPILPLPGESFQDTMKRAVAAGKTVSPQDTKVTGSDLAQAGGVLAAAPVMGAALPAAMTVPSSIAALLPSFAAASEKFEQVKEAVGDHTVGMTNELSDATQRVSQHAKSGLSMPKVIGDFIDRTINIEKYPEGAPTFNEMRDFYSTAVSKLSPDEIMKMTPRMQAALGQWTQSLGNALNDVADKGGVLSKYQQAMSEWKGASNMSDFADKAIEIGKKAAITTGVGALLGAGGAAAYRTLKELGVVQ
jgi:hypothetical protein